MSTKAIAKISTFPQRREPASDPRHEEIELKINKGYGLARALRLLLTDVSMGDDFDRNAAAELARAVEDSLWEANEAFDEGWTPDTAIARVEV